MRRIRAGGVDSGEHLTAVSLGAEEVPFRSFEMLNEHL